MIVDASVAIKWLVVEENSDLANQLVARGDLIAPDLIASEIANAMWKKFQRKELSGLPSGLATIIDVFDRIEPSARFIVQAAELALELKHPAYDCFYLALAQATGQKIVTADQRLLNKLSNTPYAELLLTLHDATQPT